MPKVVKIRRYDPPNLLGKFSADDISQASGTDLGSSRKYYYNAGNDLRLWLRFSKNLQELTNHSSTTLSYINNPVFSKQKVYSSRLETAEYDSITTSSGIVEYSGTNNSISFGDGTSDSPFSITFWYKRNVSAASIIDVILRKGLANSAYSNDNAEFQVTITASSGNILWELYDADRVYNPGSGNTADAQGRSTAVDTNVTDGNWHHVALTYDGRGGATAANGMKIYVDGDLISSNPGYNNNSYVAMERKSNKLFIGVGVADAATAELGIWAKELSIDEVKAIYNWTREDSVVKSGYISLPPRVRLREADNRSGCYPTKHRMGDKDRSGKQNIFYEDLPIKFGSCVKDDFENVNTDDLGNAPLGSGNNRESLDENKWALSNHMSIRTDIYRDLDVGIVRDKCLVFSGRGTIEAGEFVRFLRVKNKIINPISIDFDVIQGPYSIGNHLQFGGLDLGHIVPFTRNPSFVDSLYNGLRIQASTHPDFGSNPTVNVAFVDLQPDQRDFYGHEGTEFPVPRRKRISLDMSSFKAFEDGFYLRIAQKNHDFAIANFAISKISIRYGGQTINYPLLLDHNDRAGNKISRNYIANPHQSGSLTGIGRSVSGISDVVSPFQEFTQAASPFDETLAIENTNLGFFNTGLDPNIYPGFESPSKSKTKLTIDLSPNEETTFGYINKVTDTIEANTSLLSSNGSGGQHLMVYWNKDLKKWEKIGELVTFNNKSGASYDDFTHVLSSSCVGFSPLNFIGTGSYTDIVLNDRRYISLSNSLIDQFGFPSTSQYVATSSAYITAQDLGITKPFLLENLCLEYDAKLQVPLSNGAETSTSAFGPVGVENNSTTKIYENLKIITPTFFLLRQFDGNSSRAEIKVKKSLRFPAQDLSYSPSTNVNTDREVITYGQTRFFLSSSDDTPADIFKHSIDVLISNGLNADANIIKRDFDSAAPTANFYSLTSSIKMNFICKIANNTGLESSTYQISPNNTQLALGKISPGRSVNDLKNSRGIVNGFSSLTFDENASVSIPNFGSNPNVEISIPTKTEKTSPYLILPKDKLIFGWQYPLMQFANVTSPGNDAQAFFSMTLFGNSKLHLYGSQVVENKEFHETVNQNLTSCAVYEHVIGDEKILDQWLVAYRGELSGSVAGQSPYNYATAGALGEFRNSSDAWEFAFNSEWTFDNNSNFYVTEKLHETLNKNPPSRRIGLRIVQGGRSSLRNIALSEGSNYSDADGFGAFYSQYLTPIRQHITTRDQDRVYTDSNIVFGELFSQSTYGGINAQAVTIDDPKHPFFLGAGVNPSFYAGLKPQYIFKPDHFGYYADMYKQGLDGKFVPKARQGFTTGYDIAINSQSPVKIKFVSGTVSEGPNLRLYTEKDVDLYLDEKFFQSSNLSTAATSSIPFIDDNTPRNRSYIETEFIAVPLF